MGWCPKLFASWTLQKLLSVTSPKKWRDQDSIPMILKLQYHDYWWFPYSENYSEHSAAFLWVNLTHDGFFQRVKSPWLVGGIPTPLKNMSSSDGIIIPNIWKVIKFMFQSPPLWLFNIANWKMAGLQMIFPARNQIPSGKLTVHYGKSPIFMGNLTISMAIFNSKLLVYQRVNPIKLPVNPTKSHIFNHH